MEFVTHSREETGALGARLARAAGDAAAALASNANPKLVLTNLAVRLAQP